MTPLQTPRKGSSKPKSDRNVTQPGPELMSTSATGPDAVGRAVGRP
jgi:hypothetical protein